jgi:hypothetical protein
LKKYAPWAAALLFAFCTAANAQEIVMPPEPAEPPVDCRAAPADQPSGEGATLPSESKLDDCGPVLKPPVSPDGEIAVEPQQGGETPVIPPSQVPPPAAGETE